MFTIETAKAVSAALNSEVEKEFKLMLDDLIAHELTKIQAMTPDLELRVIAVKKDLLERLKNYRQHLDDVRKRYASSS